MAILFISIWALKKQNQNLKRSAEMTESNVNKK